MESEPAPADDLNAKTNNNIDPRYLSAEMLSTTVNPAANNGYNTACQRFIAQRVEHVDLFSTVKKYLPAHPNAFQMTPEQNDEHLQKLVSGYERCFKQYLVIISTV